MSEWNVALARLRDLRKAIGTIPEPAPGLKGEAAQDAARAEIAKREALELVGRVDAQLSIGRALDAYARGER